MPKTTFICSSDKTLKEGRNIIPSMHKSLGCYLLLAVRHYRAGTAPSLITGGKGKKSKATIGP